MKCQSLFSDKNKKKYFKMSCAEIFTQLVKHYENTPIQIYRKFHLQKLKIFRLKNSDFFFIFLLKT